MLSWRGRAASVLKAWDGVEAAKLVFIDGNINSGRAVDAGYSSLIALLHQARHSLQMATIGPVSAAVAKGAVFDYFDELRKIIERASSEILFVDPYLDADFVSRYLPFVPKGTRIRLLGRKGLATLLPAADAFAAQHGTQVEVRTIDQLHDRYIFVDGKECFQSGASFKDGAAKAPTTLTQITDAFTTMAQTYEALWQRAQVHRP